MKNLFIYLFIYLFIVSCEKRKFYVIPFIEGYVYDNETKSSLNNVNISIITFNKHWLNKTPTKYTNTYTTKNGYFSTKPFIIEYNGDSQDIQRVSFLYLEYILIQKKGYVSDTIEVADFWKSGDTIAVIDTVYLKPIKK